MIKTITAYAPATCANVIVGFDILGFACDFIGDEVTLVSRDDKEIIIGSIESTEALPFDIEKNTASVVIKKMIENLKMDMGFTLHIKKGIPLSSGLGGSAASAVAAAVACNGFLRTPLTHEELLPYILCGEAIASGDVAASGGAVSNDVVASGHAVSSDDVAANDYAVSGDDVAANDHAVSSDSVAASSAAVTGNAAVVSNEVHADNIAPCLYGGLTLVTSLYPLKIISLPIPDVFCVFVHPHIKINTKDARKILSSTILLKNHIRQTQQLAGFIVSLYQNNKELLKQSLTDFIIEPQRAHYIPCFQELKKMAMERGALGISLSGSGPTLFAWTEKKEDADAIGIALSQHLQRERVNAEYWVSKISSEGAKIISKCSGP